MFAIYGGVRWGEDTNFLEIVIEEQSNIRVEFISTPFPDSIIEERLEMSVCVYSIPKTDKPLVFVDKTVTSVRRLTAPPREMNLRDEKSLKSTDLKGRIPKKKGSAQILINQINTIPVKRIDFH